MLPAGFVEYGEDAAETAVREVSEETGLVVELDGFLGIYFGGGDPRGAAHLAVFGARVLGGVLTPGDDAADARWFAAADIPVSIAFEAHRKAIERWVQAKPRAVHQPTLLLYAGAGPAPPVVVHVVIENPKGTVDRIAYDPVRCEFVPTGEVFANPLPIHYGVIPCTVSQGDGRELDVAIVGEGDAAVGSVIAARPVGTLLRTDLDHKVLAIRADIPSAYTAVTDAAQRPELQEQLEGLFRTRATLSGWASASQTRRLVLDCQEAWVEKQRTGN
jgi:inorganic pyrophosphatase